MKKSTHVLISAGILVFIIAFLVAFKFIIFSMQFFGTCSLYESYGLYCPACGFTRGSVALYKGNVLLSLKFNALVVFSCLTAVMAYIEFNLKILDINVKLIPRSKIFWFTVLGFFIVYLLTRNFIPGLLPGL